MCAKCGSDLLVRVSPFPPQVLNGPLMCVISMVSSRAECPNCKAKYISCVNDARIEFGLVPVDEPADAAKTAESDAM